MQVVTAPSARRRSTRLVSITALLLLALLFPATGFAQTSRMVIKGVGAGTVGSTVGSTGLVGGGIAVEPTPLLQFFGEATWEVGHSYPADTQDPPSQTSDVGEPFVVIISNTPLVGVRGRVNGVYFAGLRLVTPPDRTVRTFVDVGTGLAQFKGTTTPYPDSLQHGHYTETLGVWGVGGGLMKTVRDRWVVDSEYRWCHLWSEVRGVPFHRVQVGIGLAF